MAKTADRVEKRDLGKWILVDEVITVAETTAGGGATNQTAILLGESLSTVNPITMYGFNLSASLGIQGKATTAVLHGVLAITKLSNAERVENSPQAGVIARPASISDINDRPWRYWLPFQLQSDTGAGIEQSPWYFHPMRLPLKGNIKLDEGQRLAIILSMPGNGNAGNQVSLRVWGRHRYITHD